MSEARSTSQSRWSAGRIIRILCLVAFVFAACAAEDSDTGAESANPEVEYRDRLPIDSFPGALPSHEPDSLQRFESSIQALLDDSDLLPGVLEEPDSAIYATARAPGGDLIAAGHDPSGEVARLGEPVEGTRLLRVDPEREKVPPTRSVFGTDDRGTPRDLYPYRSVGKLIMASGAHCTASLVGPRHILTASHCFLPDGNFEGAVFVPYYEDGKDPHDHARLERAFGRLPGGTPADDDFAVGVLDQPLGDEVGWLGYASISDGWFAVRDQPIPSFAAVGYSGDWYDGHRMAADWGAWLWWRSQAGHFIVAHDGDVVPGASGGPILAQFQDGGWAVVGIVVAGPRIDRLPQKLFRPGFANWLVDGARFVQLIQRVRADYP